MSARSSIRDWSISRRIEPILLSEKKAPQPITRKVEVLLLFWRRIPLKFKDYFSVKNATAMAPGPTWVPMAPPMVPMGR